MIQGYAGLRLSFGELKITPICFEGATKVKLNSFFYLGNELSLEYKCDLSSSSFPNPNYFSLKKINEEGTKIQVSGPIYIYQDHTLDSESVTFEIKSKNVQHDLKNVYSVPATFSLKEILKSESENKMNLSNVRVY